MKYELRTAVGFIRRAASGTAREWEESEIHRVAGELGYTVAAMVYDVSRRGAVIDQLRAIVWGEDADVVVTPGAQHMSRVDVEDLAGYADVIYMRPAQRFSRRGLVVVASDLWDADTGS